MRDAARVMEAALERIADPTEIAGMGVTEAMTGPAAVELRARMEMAHRALAEVRALPASNTETELADGFPRIEWCVEHGDRMTAAKVTCFKGLRRGSTPCRVVTATVHICCEREAEEGERDA
jgi:hypothetical protein